MNGIGSRSRSRSPYSRSPESLLPPVPFTTLDGMLTVLDFGERSKHVVDGTDIDYFDGYRAVRAVPLPTGSARQFCEIEMTHSYSDVRDQIEFKLSFQNQTNNPDVCVSTDPESCWLEAFDILGFKVNGDWRILWGWALPDIHEILKAEMARLNKSNDSSQMEDPVPETSHQDEEISEYPGEMLVAAAEEGDAMKVVQILQAGVDPNARDLLGMTALLSASMRGHADVVACLCDRNADVNEQTAAGTTSLYWAAEEGHTEVVDILLKTDCSVNTKNHHGDTALHRAAYRNHEGAVRLLIEAGADVNAKNSEGLLPINVTTEGSTVWTLLKSATKSEPKKSKSRLRGGLKNKKGKDKYNSLAVDMPPMTNPNFGKK